MPGMGWSFVVPWKLLQEPGEAEAQSLTSPFKVVVLSLPKAVPHAVLTPNHEIILLLLHN